jgi:hypothetical protein
MLDHISTVLARKNDVLSFVLKLNRLACILKHGATPTAKATLPGTSREIDIAAERIIIYCDATFLLKPNRRRCFCCIYRQDTLIRAMVNAVAKSASDGLFDLQYLDIYLAHREKSISQQRGSSSAVMQLFF